MREGSIVKRHEPETQPDLNAFPATPCGLRNAGSALEAETAPDGLENASLRISSIPIRVLYIGMV